MTVYCFLATEKELRQAAKSSGQCLVSQEDGTGNSYTVYKIHIWFSSSENKMVSSTGALMLDVLNNLFHIQGPYSEIKKQMDKIDPLAHPLLQW